ncbi:MAG TPA: hypothetical protein VME45_18495 [Stellaceae bacterium]|nr:hypothetical protein [Stellaceae bacterium]
MHKIMMLVAGALALTGVAAIQPAQAGCLSGAAVGGVAGHFAGHHGLIGAGIGCAVGHHRAVTRERERAHDYNRY